ncbi:MAG: sigma-54-dependent Fis family transcriptional regulator [Deltaproteobacteria bacterium]|nr:sigma-54-dependent Fis family transcriptional regulator [Deltaproteobacteria bacterium]
MELNERQGQSVLVVDDEPDMRSALSHALTRSGYSVESAANGFEALAKFKSEDFGIVITDVKMPEMSGMQVLGEIKKISPQIPVIMITAYGTINSAVEAMKEGASDYIIKPFSSETLEATVKKCCAKFHDQERIKSFKTGSRTVVGTERIITQDPTFLEILEMAKKVATSSGTVLILGESGTGKELLASFIHQNSGRSNQPYVALNCAALPENLAESELFGHEKGAFTGAARRKLGKLELADHGTVVLDEISEMPMALQAKLLRALQEREIDRVGGSRPVPIAARIIAISNVDLKKAVKEGKFREDLFYRVNVIPFTIPPLRNRKPDIPLLVDHFLEKFCSINDKQMTSISEEGISLLMKCEWKGNVRELENVIERATLLGEGKVLLPKHLFLERQESNAKKSIPFTIGISVKEMEKELIFQTLEEVKDNRTHAAKLLGISIRTLRNKLREYGMGQQM